IQLSPARGFAAMDRIILIVTVMLAALPSLAQVPNYDTARHCTDFARGSQTAENQCRRNEADARRELEKTRVPHEVWSYCEEQIRTEQSYRGCRCKTAQPTRGSRSCRNPRCRGNYSISAGFPRGV